MGDEPKVRRMKAPTYEIPENPQPLPYPFPSLREDEAAAVEALRSAYEREGIQRVIVLLDAAGLEDAVRYNMKLGEEPPGEIPGCPPDPDLWPRHELHVLSVPRESRKRFAVYIRRRYGYPLKAALDAARFTPNVLLRGKTRQQVEDALADIRTLGVEAELVIGEEQDDDGA